MDSRHERLAPCEPSTSPNGFVFNQWASVTPDQKLRLGSRAKYGLSCPHKEKTSSSLLLVETPYKGTTHYTLPSCLETYKIHLGGGRQHSTPIWRLRREHVPLQQPQGSLPRTRQHQHRERRSGRLITLVSRRWMAPLLNRAKQLWCLITGLGRTLNGIYDFRNQKPLQFEQFYLS